MVNGIYYYYLIFFTISPSFFTSLVYDTLMLPGFFGGKSQRFVVFHSTVLQDMINWQFKLPRQDPDADLEIDRGQMASKNSLKRFELFTRCNSIQINWVSKFMQTSTGIWQITSTNMHLSIRKSTLRICTKHKYHQKKPVIWYPLHCHHSISKLAIWYYTYVPISNSNRIPELLGKHISRQQMCSI
jgi:hypothetical protein